jgi:hypothetical protein
VVARLDNRGQIGGGGENQVGARVVGELSDSDPFAPQGAFDRQTDGLSSSTSTTGGACELTKAVLPPDPER